MPKRKGFSGWNSIAYMVQRESLQTPSKPRNSGASKAHRDTGFLNSNGKSADEHWNDYIASMRGTMTRVPPDIHKVGAVVARRGAAERFFTARDQSRANRNAFHLSAMLKRQTG